MSLKSFLFKIWASLVAVAFFGFLWYGQVWSHQPLTPGLSSLDIVIGALYGLLALGALGVIWLVDL